MKLSILSLAALTPLVAAHFKLDYPTPRGENEDKMTTFPCGGLAQSSERTNVSISDGSFPVAVTMGHTQTAFEVLLSLGNDPGTNFNVTLVPIFGARGLGSLCIPHVAFDEDTLGVNITDGMNATVQVQSNGDPTGGLYAVCLNCPFNQSRGQHANETSVRTSNSPPAPNTPTRPARTTPTSLPHLSPEKLPSVTPMSPLPMAAHRAVALRPRTRIRPRRRQAVLSLCKPLLGVCLVRRLWVVWRCCDLVHSPRGVLYRRWVREKVMLYE